MPREAEVEDLDPTVSREEQVLGLEIPVDNPLLVGGGEAIGDLDAVLDGLSGREWPLPDHFSQRLAFE